MADRLQRGPVNAGGNADAPDENVEEFNVNPPGLPNRAALDAAAEAAVAAAAAAGLPPALAAAGAVPAPPAAIAALLNNVIVAYFRDKSRLYFPVAGEKSMYRFVGSYLSLQLIGPFVRLPHPGNPAAAEAVALAVCDVLYADVDAAAAALPVAGGPAPLPIVAGPGPAQPTRHILMTSESVRVARAAVIGPGPPVVETPAPPNHPLFHHFLEAAGATICGPEKKRDVEAGVALPGPVGGLVSRRPWLVDVPCIELGAAAIAGLGAVPHGPVSQTPLGLCVAPMYALFERGYGVGFPAEAVRAAGVRLPAHVVGASARRLAGVVVLDSNGVAPPTAGRVYGALIEVSFDWGLADAAHQLRQGETEIMMRGLEDTGDALGLMRRSWALAHHVFTSLMGTAGLPAAVLGLGPLEDADILIVFEPMAPRPGLPFVAAWPSFGGFSYRNRAIQLAGARPFLSMELSPPAQASDPMPRHQGFYLSNSLAVGDGGRDVHRHVTVNVPGDLVDALPLRFLFGRGMPPVPARVRLVLMPAYGRAYVSLRIDVTAFNFEQLRNQNRFTLNVKQLVAAIDELPPEARPYFNRRTDLRVSLALPGDVPGLPGDAVDSVDLVVFLAANQAAFVPPRVGGEDAAIAALVDVALVRTHLHHKRPYNESMQWAATRAFFAAFPDLANLPAAGTVEHLRTVAFAGAGLPRIRPAAIAVGTVSGRPGWTGAVNNDRLDPGERSVSSVLREFVSQLTPEQLVQARRNGVAEHYSVGPDGVRVITFRVATDREAAMWGGLTAAQRQAPPAEGWHAG